MTQFEIGEDIDAIVEQIDGFIAEEDLDQASALCDAAIETHAGDVQLYASRAEIALERDDHDAVIEAVDAVLEDVEDEEQRGLLLNLKAHAHYYKDEHDPARRLFNESLRSDFEVWSALLGRARTHERMGFLVAALLDLEHAIQLDDQEADPFALRGRIYLRRGALEEAERDFGYAIESDPFEEEARISLARLQARRGATADAIETVELLIEDGENNDIVATAALLRSQLSLTLNSTEAAAEDAELAIERWPDAPWGYLQLAACQLTSMNPNAAIKTLKEAERRVENTRDIPDVFALRATAYDQLEKSEKADRERAKAEGMARLPMVVYGPILNPAGNAPINPDKPIDIRAIMADLFGSPENAPDGYEDALREVIDQIPDIIAQNPEVERIQIELPEVEGMAGPARNLMIQVNRGQDQAEA